MLIRRSSRAFFALCLLIAPNALAASISVNSTASDGFELGINCRGNFWCPWISADANHIILYFLYWMKTSMNDADIYAHGVHIACASLYGSAAFCAYTQGHNVPPSGINGSGIKRKLTQLSDHGCFACGSVPIADDNNPKELGILTINYVLKPACLPSSSDLTPICPPTIPAHNKTSTPRLPGTPQAFEFFNLTAMESQAGLQERD